jgi:hypothetical protein
MTKAQRDLMAAIHSGKVRSLQSNSRQGRTLRVLIAKGLVRADRVTSVPTARTPHGARVPGFVCWGGLSVTKLHHNA